MSEKGKSTYIN